ncbi:MAG: cysteine desulfurase [Deltaproteobacteria bacterium]|jgi:cysteine desulfurase/selenocysteine lyase|nr:cysteine desulfurase [Deltaproteobacteria bacterium]
MSFDVDSIRADFPILATRMRGQPLTYLDTAASAQKPRAVIEAISDFYSCHYANIHRGVYQLSADATRRYEEVRPRVARFIGAPDPREIIFVRNTTEAINLVARSWGESALSAGDEIVLTTMEHHANIVPWQLLCERRGTKIRVARIDDAGVLDIDHLESLLGQRTKLLAFAHVSNALGTINPVQTITALARERGITTLVDGAQAVPHQPVDVEALGCDFYAFSGHKTFGPSGAGVLWGRLPLLESMPPFLGGGDMIETVSFEGTTFADVPQKFEAGTPDIACVVGLGVAIDYLEAIGMERIATYEHSLLVYATEKLEAIPGLRLIGTAKEKAGVLSFVLDEIHPHDIGTVLDGEGVAIRAGHHCAQPLMERMGVPATARASLAFYNTREDVDRLVLALEKTRELFS